MVYDEIKLSGFEVQNTSPSVLGRCFIEVYLYILLTAHDYCVWLHTLGCLENFHVHVVYICELLFEKIIATYMFMNR